MHAAALGAFNGAHRHPTAGARVFSRAPALLARARAHLDARCAPHAAARLSYAACTDAGVARQTPRPPLLLAGAYLPLGRRPPPLLPRVQLTDVSSPPTGQQAQPPAHHLGVRRARAFGLVVARDMHRRCVYEL